MASETESPTAVTGRTFVWHEVYTPSIEGSVDFYTQALEFGVQKYEMEGFGTYTMLTREGKGVAGVVTPHQPGTPSHWAAYLSVDDVDKRLAKCQELGAQVLVPAMDVPTVGRMALIRDPQGAALWLFKPEMPS